MQCEAVREVGDVSGGGGRVPMAMAAGAREGGSGGVGDAAAEEDAACSSWRA